MIFLLGTTTSDSVAVGSSATVGSSTAVSSSATAGNMSLVLLVGAGVLVGAIAVLVGQRIFKTFISFLNWPLGSDSDDLDRQMDSARNRSTSINQQQGVSEESPDWAETPTTVTIDASQGNGKQGSSDSDSSGQSVLQGAAKFIGKMAKSALSSELSSELSPNKAESSGEIPGNGANGNGSVKQSSSQLPQSKSKSKSNQLSNSISRHERAEKKNLEEASRPAEMPAKGISKRMNTLKQSLGSQKSSQNQHINSTGNETLMSVLLSFVASHRGGVILTAGLLVADLILWILPHPTGYLFVEVPVSLGVAIAISLLGSQLFREFFDGYLLNAAVREGRKLNSEFLILAKFAANGVIILIAVVAFAQTHQINIFGILASLGIGGLAVAFAAQKTLEQLLGGIVIYLDRPFVVDDYVGLPDGTFGRVESIGLRSTKVRTSGKGTLMIVPNSVLTQINIENFTGAKKVMSIVYLDLYRLIPDDEKALIRQVILESTVDIFGIDSRSTDVTFRPVPQTKDRTQVQITFFILGSGEVSMDLRRQVLDLANQNITQQLSDYGLRFDMEEPTIYVDSPITI